MGVTSFSMQLIERYLPGVKNVCELGAQNNYAQPKLPAPYMKEWYEARGIEYDCIDLSAENGCTVADLSKVLEFEEGEPQRFDLVTDFGTSEHVSDYYNCWLNKWNLCKDGGVIISENPMTGNWPGHGLHYLDTNFYFELAEALGCKLMGTGTQAACNNTTDGWNVWGIIVKQGEFLSAEEFKKLPVCKS